jgi:hypothetical protein
MHLIGWSFSHAFAKVPPKQTKRRDIKAPGRRLWGTGLKPHSFFRALRGAEAPLFHGCAGSSEGKLVLFISLEQAHDLRSGSSDSSISESVPAPSMLRHSLSEEDSDVLAVVQWKQLSNKWKQDEESQHNPKKRTCGGFRIDFRLWLHPPVPVPNSSIYRRCDHKTPLPFRCLERRTCYLCTKGDRQVFSCR